MVEILEMTPDRFPFPQPHCTS